jgi:hypothetical protein
MAVWSYDPEEWVRTRQVDVGGCLEDGQPAVPDEDGSFRWRRRRTGEEGRVVAISGGYSLAKWAYRSAVKENIGLDVPVPEGVEPVEVLSSDTEPDVPDVPAEPEA